MKKEQTSLFFFIYLTIISICHILPAVKYSLSYPVLAGMFILIYFFTIDNWKMPMKPDGQVFIMAAILGLMYLIVVDTGNFVGAINEIIRHFRCCAPGMIYLYAKRKEYTKGKRLFVFIMFGVLLFVCFRTIQNVTENPSLVRLLAMGNGIDDEIRAYRYKNVGGFEYSYMMGFLFVLLICLMLEAKKQWQRISLLAFIGFAGFYIIQVEYMLLLIISLIFGIYALIKVSDYTTTKIVTIIAGLVLLVSIPIIYQALINSSLSTLAYKFNQFIDFVNGNGLASLGSRPQRLIEAFLRFLESPIWGNTSYSAEVMNESHSTMLGYLQSTGIIGTVAFYVPLFALHRAINQSFQYRKTQSIFSILFFMLIVLSIFNPFQNAQEVFIFLFLIAPSCLDVFVEKVDSYAEEVSVIENFAN